MHVNLRLLNNSKIPAKVLLSSIAFATKGVVAGGDMPIHVHTLCDDVFVTDNELFINRYFLKIDVVDAIKDPDVLALLTKPDASIYIRPDAIESCFVLSPLKSRKDKKQLVRISIKSFEFVCCVDLDVFFSALCRTADAKIYFLKLMSHDIDMAGIIKNGERNIILSGANILTIQPYDDKTSYITMKNGRRFIVEKTIESF